MAKALLGYVGRTDPRLLEEARLLRVRVRDLEEQVSRLQHENEFLTAALDDLRVGVREPALT